MAAPLTAKHNNNPPPAGANQGAAPGGKNKKSSRLGKKERWMAKGMPSQTPAQTGEKSVSGAHKFAAPAEDPKPTPGAYPAVFDASSRLVSKDVPFTYKGSSFEEVLTVYPRYLMDNRRIDELLVSMDLSRDEFSNWMVRLFFLALAQQTVHSHVNLGFPQGDFSPVANTRTLVPTSLLRIVERFGETQFPTLGFQAVLKDYASTVNSLVYTAEKLGRDYNVRKACDNWWLPMSKSDERTMFIIGEGIKTAFKAKGLTITDEEFNSKVFKEPPRNWECLRKLFVTSIPQEGKPDLEVCYLDVFFKPLKDEASFFGLIDSAYLLQALEVINLAWTNPGAGDLDWKYNSKYSFSTLVDQWAPKLKFLEGTLATASVTDNKSAACGSMLQFGEVKRHGETTMVHTLVASTAPEMSLNACFNFSALFPANIPLGVVVQTNLLIEEIACDFVQLDWA